MALSDTVCVLSCFGTLLERMDMHRRTAKLFGKSGNLHKMHQNATLVRPSNIPTSPCISVQQLQDPNSWQTEPENWCEVRDCWIPSRHVFSQGAIQGGSRLSHSKVVQIRYASTGSRDDLELECLAGSFIRKTHQNAPNNFTFRESTWAPETSAWSSCPCFIRRPARLLT